MKQLLVLTFGNNINLDNHTFCLQDSTIKSDANRLFHLVLVVWLNLKKLYVYSFYKEVSTEHRRDIVDRFY